MQTASFTETSAVEFLAGGEFYLFDEGHLFKDGQISTELQAAIDQLTAHGVRVIIFSSNNPYGLTTDALIREFVMKNGYSTNGITIGPNDLLCTINLKNERGETDVDCMADLALSRTIDNLQISEVVDAIFEQGICNLDAGGRSNFDHGFTVAYQGVD